MKAAAQQTQVSGVKLKNIFISYRDKKEYINLKYSNRLLAQ